MNRKLRWIAASITALVVLTVVSTLVFVARGTNAPRYELIDGTVECDEIDVSPKVPGRIKQLLVDEGDPVHAGELLAVLESQEIDAKVQQASAAYQATLSRVSHADTALKLQRLTYTDQLGEARAQFAAHREEVRQAEENLNQAKAAYKTQLDTYKRFHGLYQEGVIPKQSEDEYEYRYLAAKAQLGAAESKVAQAEQGLKAAASALQLAADARLQVDLKTQEHSAAAEEAESVLGQMNEALALQKETRLLAPVEGYVAQKVSNAGDMVAAGFPVLTLAKRMDFKVKVYADESKFGHLALNHLVKVIIPALGNSEVNGRIIRISQAADFATKRVTNEQGSFDVRAVQIVIKITDDNPKLRNGMTARAKLEYEAH